MRAPPSPRTLLLTLLALGFLFAFVQVGLISIAFDKLGLSPAGAYLLLGASLLGSLVNVPLFSLRSDLPPPAELPPIPGFPGFPLWRFSNRTVVALNVGGGLIPALFSFYLLEHTSVTLIEEVQGVFFVSIVSYFFSRPISGLGIGMPILIAPLSAALVAVLLKGEAGAPLAYISGTLGVLIGADLLRLKDIRRLGAPLASIGGAGTFDGIFITGIVAVLLA